LDRFVAKMNDLIVLEPEDQRWKSFVDSNDQATIFHHPAWIQLLSESYDQQPFVIAVSDSDGNIRAGMPIVNVQSFLTGHRWASLPFTDHCAPLYEDDYWLHHLTDCVLELYQKGEAPRIELRWEYPLNPVFYQSNQYVLTLLQLDSEPELVAKRIDHKYRRMPRVAQERGAHAILGKTLDDIDTFYQLHTVTRQRLGVPVQPRKFFKLLWKYIIDPGLGFVIHIYKDGNCLSSAVFLHWKHTLVYKYSATSGAEKQLSPNDLLMWTAIQWGCENGYKVLDLGRSNIDNQGLRYFKLRWGAEENPLVYSILSERKTGLPNGRLMNILESVICHSPLWICRLAGELLYRHFG
jgi:CelD/BcsL family acetyltransferase involved in cellulose biosynthesis